MKKNSTLIILCVVFGVIIVSIFFVNKWLESEISNDASDNEVVKAATVTQKTIKKVEESQSVKDLEASMSDGEKMSEFEQEFMKDKNPVYEEPIEDVILLQ